MDPDANLAEQLRWINEINALVDACDPEGGGYTLDQSIALQEAAARLAELVEALNQWIKGGGFLPAAWGRGRS